MRIRSKFWLEDDEGEPIFGEGRLKILELIKEFGTMQAAAKNLGMSYRGVWARIKATEERLGIKLVETAVGRGRGRGSHLTPEAKKLLDDYEHLNQVGREYADKLFAEIFQGQGEAESSITPVVAVVGPDGCGKKKLISDLASQWEKRGRRIGVLIFTPITEEFPDSQKEYLTNGVSQTIETNTDRMNIGLKGQVELTPETIAANFFPRCDLVLAPFTHRVHLPTIELFKKKQSDTLLTRKTKNILAVVGDKPGDKPTWPHFKRNDLDGVIDLVEDRLKEYIRESRNVTLMVNGLRVPMLPFVQAMFENTMLGMVSSLKACENPREIELVVKNSDHMLKKE